MPKIAVLPQDDKTNGWSRILPARQAHAPLEGEVRADWVVVGAGYAGLGAARRLAENRPDDKVVLLEAQEAGEGASGRNSGFGIDVPHSIGSEEGGNQRAKRELALARAGIAYLERQVTAHGIACDWARRGMYHAAASARGTGEVLEPMAAQLDGLDETYRWVKGSALKDEVGTAHFHAALHTPGCILMNPAALNRGLADTMPDNVTVHERSPVTAVEYRNGIHLTTPGGSLYAPNMIIAVNGFAQQFGFYKGRFLVLAAHASLSRRLDEAERRALGGVENWGLTPVNAFAGITMRLTADRRILIRQNIQFRPSFRVSDAERAAVRREHQRLFQDRFPMLPGVTMEHTWTGFVCLSGNGAPAFGRVAPNVTAALCQNAVGVAKGTASGMLAADLASGQDNPLIAHMEAMGTPEWLPPRPFLDLGVRARFAWDLWRARHEA